MSKIGSIQAATYVFFSLIFYFIGVVALASTVEVISVTAFLLITTFLLAKSSPFSNYNLNMIVLRFSGFDFFTTLIVLYLFIVLVLSIGYALNGVPVFSDNVEVARMQLVNDYGVVYRVVTQALFFAPVMLVYGLCNRFIGRPVFWFMWLLTFVMLFSMGFRSRIVDYSILTIISYYIISDIKFNFSVKNIFAMFLGCLCVGVGLIFLIAWLTAAREGIDEPFEALNSVMYRAFYLNYIVNFERIYVFVDHNGYKFGLTFLTDFISMVSSTVDSMQVEVTKYFNYTNSDLFIMTPTVYGEFYLNFGYMAFAAAIPIFYVYRFAVEFIAYILSKLPATGVLFVCFLVNLVYYFPRQIVTGGISNAFVVRVASIVIVFLLFYVLIQMFKLMVSRR